MAVSLNETPDRRIPAPRGCCEPRCGSGNAEHASEPRRTSALKRRPWSVGCRRLRSHRLRVRAARSLQTASAGFRRRRRGTTAMWCVLLPTAYSTEAHCSPPRSTQFRSWPALHDSPTRTSMSDWSAGSKVVATGSSCAMPVTGDMKITRLSGHAVRHEFCGCRQFFVNSCESVPSSDCVRIAANCLTALRSMPEYAEKTQDCVANRKIGEMGRSCGQHGPVGAFRDPRFPGVTYSGSIGRAGKLSVRARHGSRFPRRLGRISPITPPGGS